MESTTLPHHYEAEIGILGSIIIDNKLLSEYASEVTTEMFFNSKNKEIFSTMLKLKQKSIPIDHTTLIDDLTKNKKLDYAGGAAYIIGLGNNIMSSGWVEYYIKLVVDSYILRELINSCSKIIKDSYENQKDLEDIIDIAEKKILEISKSRIIKNTFQNSTTITKKAFTLVQDLHKTGGYDPNILPTGFYALDDLIIGLEKGSLNILAARPSMGKTAFAMSIAQNVAIKQKKSVAIFSLEMPDSQLMLRMLCSEAKINMSRIRRGELNSSEFANLQTAADILSGANIFIDDQSNLDLVNLRTKIRKLAMQEKDNLGLVVIDYLQLMSASTQKENRHNEISEISRGLKNIARELNIPVLVLSQLSRAVENRADKRPMLSDLRESGAIEQDADIVMFVYREEYYTKSETNAAKAEIIVGKNRNGSTGTIELQFNSSQVSFRNI